MDFSDPFGAWNFLKERLGEWEATPDRIHELMDAAAAMYDGYAALWEKYEPYYGEGGELGGKANVVQARMGQAAADMDELQTAMDRWVSTDVDVRTVIEDVREAVGWIMPGLSGIPVPVVVAVALAAACTAIVGIFEYIEAKKLDLARKHAEIIAKVTDAVRDGTLSAEEANVILQALNEQARDWNKPTPGGLGDLATKAVVVVAIIAAIPLITALAGSVGQRRARAA